MIIWIVKKAREEHRLAVEWLNNHTDDDIVFFLLEIELWSINQSESAVKFNVVERPNDWAKEIKKADNVMNATKKLKLDYWTAFNEYAFGDTGYARVFKKRKPSTDHWYTVSLESTEGVVLDWRELPDRKMSRILYETSVDFGDRDKWAEQFEWIKEYSVKIAKAFEEYL